MRDKITTYFAFSRVALVESRAVCQAWPQAIAEASPRTARKHGLTRGSSRFAAGIQISSPCPF